MIARTGRLAAAVVVAAALSPSAASAGFSLVSSPNAFAGNNALNGVSASSRTDAWAVGSLCCSADDFGVGTLTEHWNGASWSIVPSPDSLFNDDVLNAVTDISATNAWAVGEVNQTSFKARNPLLVHWNGSTWATVAAPSGSRGELLAVTADSPSDVWAVGDDQRGHGIVLRYNGSTWSQVTVPTSSSSTILTAVKAFSPWNVWAVGGQLSVAGTSKTLVLHWNGTAWSVVPSPNPDPNANILQAVGGASPTDIWAVGLKARDEGTTGVPPGTRTLAIHWNGTRWTSVATPSVGDQDVLTGVAATGPSSVAAVGSFDDTSLSIPVAQTLAETWAGTSWSVQSTPNVGTNDNLLKGVSAIPGTSTFWAVGVHLTNGGPYRTLIAHSP